MAVLVIDTLAAKNSGTFPIVDSSDVKGGHHEVADNTARDAIPTAKRKHGMLVFVQSSGTTYELGSDLTTWATFSSGGGGGGSGDVEGPASSTDNAIARFDSTTGKVIQNSAVTVDDSGNIATSGTVDGRDVSVDGTKLDTITVANIPTADQKAALAGSSGTPNAGNPYVTNGDSRMTNTRTPTTHATSHAGDGSDAIANATTSVAGLMSSSDKTKLDGVSASAAAVTSSAPANVTKASASAGSATDAARADHKHDIATAAASTLTVGGSNAEGSSSSLARADHGHALPAFGSSSGTFAEGSDSRFPTAGQKQALAGTTGTPSTSNPYVTTIDERLGAKATADIILAVTAGGNDSDAARPPFVTGGDYTANPYATIQAALDDCAKQLGNRTVLIEVGAGSFDGFGVRGFVGPSQAVAIRGTWSLATLTSGPNSFTAGTGTSATSLKRNGGVAWTANNLRGKFVRVTSGAGYSGTLINESIGVISSNDGDTAVIEGYGIFGMDNTSVVQIVSPGTRIATGSPETAVAGDAGVSVFGNLADVILSRLRVAFTDSTFYGIVSSSNGCQLVLQGCALGSGFHYLATDAYHYWNNNVAEDGAAIYFDNVRAIASYGLVGEDCIIDVTKFTSAIFDYTNIDGAAGNALKVYRGVFAMLGLTANNCTATPLVMQNVHNMQLGASGIQGTNSGTARGIEISDSGQYSLNGATLAGSNSDQVLLEGKAVSYTTLGAQGTTRRRSSVIHWGSGRERTMQKIYVPVDGSDPGDEIQTDGDAVLGGRLKLYGQLTLLGSAGGTVTAAGSDQAGAAALKYGSSVINAGNGGVRLFASGVGSGDGAVIQWGFNRTGSAVNLYPPSGGAINSGTTNAAISLPSNAFFAAASRGSNDFEVSVLLPEASLALANISGTLAIGKGGTGQTTQTAAMDALSPTTTKGDLLVDNGTNVVRVGVGTDGQVLKADSGSSAGVAWANETGGGGGGAPTDAEYLVATSNGSLSAERVTTDTATVTWDHATSGQAKANVPDDAITFAKMQNIASDRLLGRDTASSGNTEELTVGGGIEFTGSGGIQRSALTGDVTASAGSGSTTIASNAVTTAKIADASVTLAKVANIATDRLLGRDTASSGVVEELTVGGGVEFSGSGGIQRSALTGDVTASAGSGSTTIANSAVTTAKINDAAVTLAKMANLAQDQVIGRTTASTGVPETFTVTAAARTVLDDTTTGAMRTTLGALGGSTGSTDNALLRADGTGGATAQATGIVVTDSDEISGHKANINAQTGTTYTVQASDTGRHILLTNASAITVTVPNTLAAGFQCSWEQGGAGQITFSGGATLNNRQSHTKSAGQHAVGMLSCKTNSGGTSAVVTLGGDTAA